MAELIFILLFSITHLIVVFFCLLQFYVGIKKSKRYKDIIQKITK